MSIVFVSGTTNSGTSGLVTLTKPASIAVGDLLLIFAITALPSGTVHQYNDSSNKPSGFTRINTAGAGPEDTSVGAFWRIATGSETATIGVQAINTSYDCVGWYYRVTGANDTTPINVIGSDYEASTGTSHAITGVTPTARNCMAIYLAAVENASSNQPFSVSGTGWTETGELTGGIAGGAWGYRQLTNIEASGTATFAIASNSGVAGFQFAIRPAGGLFSITSINGVDITTVVSIDGVAIEDVVSIDGVTL